MTDTASYPPDALDAARRAVQRAGAAMFIHPPSEGAAWVIANAAVDAAGPIIAEAIARAIETRAGSVRGAAAIARDPEAWGAR